MKNEKKKKKREKFKKKYVVEVTFEDWCEESKAMTVKTLKKTKEILV